MSGKTPPWLTALVDQRLALVEESGVPAAASALGKIPLIVTPLTEPPPNATHVQHSRWDRTCDGCGEYCPYPKDFYTGQVQRTTSTGILVVMFFGVCKEHRFDGPG